MRKWLYGNNVDRDVKARARLGLAILARAWALKSAARPFRVAVAAKTHAAVSIVLDSAARRLQELLASHGQNAQRDLFQHVRIAKVCNDMEEAVPAGVEVPRP